MKCVKKIQVGSILGPRAVSGHDAPPSGNWFLDCCGPQVDYRHEIANLWCQKLLAKVNMQLNWSTILGHVCGSRLLGWINRYHWCRIRKNEQRQTCKTEALSCTKAATPLKSSLSSRHSPPLSVTWHLAFEAKSELAPLGSSWEGGGIGNISLVGTVFEIAVMALDVFTTCGVFRLGVGRCMLVEGQEDYHLNINQICAD